MLAVLSKKNTISRAEKKSVIVFLKWQLMVAVCLVALSAVCFNSAVAQSVLMGTLITVVPNVFLAIYLFIRAEKRTAKQVMRACYVGELFKLALIAIMMVLMLHFFKIAFLAFLLGFIGTYIVYWMAPLILKQSGT